MGSPIDWLVRLTARALEPSEREVVLGDLAECGRLGWGALRELLGLVTRRQVLIWTAWRPWFALIAIAGVSGFFLSGMLARLTIHTLEQLMAWRHFGVHYNTGVTSFRNDVFHMSCLAAAVLCWTAINMSLLRRLSDRANWMNALLFYVMALGWSVTFAIQGMRPRTLESLFIVVFLFAIPVVCGALERFPFLAPATLLCTLAAALLGTIRAHDLQNFSHGAFPAPPWYVVIAPYAFVSWPMLTYLRRHSAEM